MMKQCAELRSPEPFYRRTAGLTISMITSLSAVYAIGSVRNPTNDFFGNEHLIVVNETQKSRTGKFAHVLVVIDAPE